MGLILKHVEIMVMNGKPFKRKDEQKLRVLRLELWRRSGREMDLSVKAISVYSISQEVTAEQKGGSKIQTYVETLFKETEDRN